MQNGSTIFTTYDNALIVAETIADKHMQRERRITWNRDDRNIAARVFWDLHCNQAVKDQVNYGS